MSPFFDSLSVFTTTFDYLRRSTKVGADLMDLRIGWAEDILARMRIHTEVRGEVSDLSPLLFLGNHISYLDIPLLMRTARRVSFVAKSEVGHWPVIGQGARAMDTIFVKRECGERRAAARAQLATELGRGARIAVFPSGTTCMGDSKTWKRGAFELAHSQGVPVQPFRVRYTPLRTAAYINRDFFPWHLYQLARKGGVEATIEFHAPVEITDPVADCERWRAWSQAAF